MLVTVGRIVHYVLTADDAAEINRRRTTSQSIAERLLWGPAGRHAEAIPARSTDGSLRAWPAGAQAHIGNSPCVGDVVPLVVVRVWPHEFGQDTPGVNGQALLDGNDVLWITSAKEGTAPGTWCWPPKVS